MKEKEKLNMYKIAYGSVHKHPHITQNTNSQWHHNDNSVFKSVTVSWSRDPVVGQLWGAFGSIGGSTGRR